jgi:hypothetical protein
MSEQSQSSRFHPNVAVILAAFATLTFATLPSQTGSAATRTSGGSGPGCIGQPRMPLRKGKILGIVPARPIGGLGRNCTSGPPPGASSFNGTPPLIYHGGPVMGTVSTPGESTMTPIYWAPTGYNFPSTYQSIINGYISNVAADSGKPTNVFAASTQYTNGTSHINYKIHAGTALADTNGFPISQGCTPDSGPIY